VFSFLDFASMFLGSLHWLTEPDARAFRMRQDVATTAHDEAAKPNWQFVKLPKPIAALRR
jgi:hypothetical protein